MKAHGVLKEDRRSAVSAGLFFHFPILTAAAGSGNEPRPGQTMRTSRPIPGTGALLPHDLLKRPTELLTESCPKTRGCLDVRPAMLVLFPQNGLKRNGNVPMDTSFSSGMGPRRGARTHPTITALRVLGIIAATAATLAFLAVGVLAPLLHIGFSPVLTGSMRPAYAPGDLLITAPRTSQAFGPARSPSSRRRENPSRSPTASPPSPAPRPSRSSRPRGTLTRIRTTGGPS